MLCGCHRRADHNWPVRWTLTTPRHSLGQGQAGMGPRFGFCLDVGDKEHHSVARGEVAGGQERQILGHGEVPQ